MNHLSPHIKLLSQYLGAEYFYEIRTEYQEFADHRHQQSVAQARQSITRLIDKI